MASKFEGKNYYEILEVSRDASKEVIKKAYKDIALIYHPDSNFFNEILGNKENTNKSLEDFQIITNAFNVLTDDKKRKEYDDTLITFKDWSEEESADDYFQDMFKKKSIEYGIRNLQRERESTLFNEGINADYFQRMNNERKNKTNEKSKEYLSKIANSRFSQITKTRFSNKSDLLMILCLGFLTATIILYFLAY